MRILTRACILFFVSVCIILSMPFLVSGEDHATYDAPNITYGNISCGTGQIHANQSCWWCWINYTNKVMDHSFMNYSQMDAYYNSSGDSVIIGGETYTLSAYKVGADSVLTSEPSIISGIFAYIQALFT